MQWLATKPLSRVIALRLIIEPLRLLLCRYFEVAGDEFEVSQRIRLLRGPPPGSDVAKRSYRVSLVASGALDTECMRRLAGVFEDDMWTAIERDAHTFGERALFFRCLSRVGALVEVSLRERHRRFPLALFAILENRSVASDLARRPMCLMDTWSRSLAALHPNFADEQFLAKLTLAAHLAFVDTAGIECRHATLRRYITAMSIQTHTLSLRNLAAHFVLQQARARRQWVRRFVKNVVVKAAAPKVTSDTKETIGVGGNV